MPAADLTPYYQPSGSGADGTKFDNALAYLQGLLNGLDASNWATGKIFPPSKLTQEAATTKQILLWDGSQWSPSGGYTAYAPTWTSTGVAPALGNGTIVASYIQIGKLVQGSMILTMGSTTTYGTGVYIFSMPVAPGGSTGANTPLGVASVLDSSSGQLTWQGLAFGVSGFVLVSMASPGILGSPVSPITFAVGDFIQINFTYQAA